MKKSVAVMMILAIVLSLGASAFAETISVIVPSNGTSMVGNDYDYDYLQGQTPQGERKLVKETDVGLLICNMDDDTIHQFVPMPLVTNVEYKEREKLPQAAADALKEAHDTAKQTEGKSLKQSYFFSVPENFDVDEDHYAKYVFSCPGKNVEVSVNGNPVEVVSINGRTSYIAKVTERGCITITVSK